MPELVAITTQGTLDDLLDRRVRNGLGGVDSLSWWMYFLDIGYGSQIADFHVKLAQSYHVLFLSQSFDDYGHEHTGF